jgi:HK97 family phage major capsid protein
MTDTVELKSMLQAATSEIKSLVKQQDEEIKSQGEATSDVAKALAKLTATIDEIKAELDTTASKQDELEAKAMRMAQGQSRAKSLGESVTESAQFKSYMERGGRGDSAAISVKDITGAGASAGPLAPEFRVPNIFMNPDRVLFARQLVKIASHSSSVSVSPD